MKALTGLQSGLVSPADTLLVPLSPMQCVMGVDLDTLRPQPSVEGYTTPGGYSYRAVKPIALAKVAKGQGIDLHFI